MTDTILDSVLVKDLLNHIYEKRKATAFQIEGLTKAALARNDSASISKIIDELATMANGGNVSAKMGAITALGSVSVALGSFAIAYFLDDIVRPIFSTFRDTDARVRYYACESLYNISKIARGEILLHFNEVFDILCKLVTDTESSVKNAADILDRLIKDIVSAKSTNYVSILHQQNEEADPIQSSILGSDGMSYQVNLPQDSSKAFSLPRFIPTLLERMYTIEPFAKKFLLSWLELFDDLPTAELITFLPNFLEPLIRFLMNGCPSDVRIETQNLLNIFLKEVKTIHKVRFDVKKNQMVKARIAEKKPAPTKSLEVAEGLDGLQIDDASSVKSTSTTVIHKKEETPAAEESVTHEEEEPLFINGQDIFIDYSKVISILLSFLRPSSSNDDDEGFNDLSGESHEVYVEIQTTVLRWLQELLLISPTSFSKFLPNSVSIIMQNVAITDDNDDSDLRNQFLNFNLGLQNYLLSLNTAVSTENDDQSISDQMVQGLSSEVYEEFLELYLKETLHVVMEESLLRTNELARLTSLDWLTFLYQNYSSSFFLGDSEAQADETMSGKFTVDLTSLLRSSADASPDVISKVLQLASTIADDNQEFFKDLMFKLIQFFEAESRDLDGNASSRSRDKTEFIVKRLCMSLTSEMIFLSFSEVLVSSEQHNLEFMSDFIVSLNNILLTAPELADLRRKLKNLDLYKNEDWQLFQSLFQSWSHNAPSALSLCLLTSNYELAYLIIKNLAELEVTVQLLTQLDILIQLLELNIFTKLRLQLLEPEKHPHLYKTLYGIMMIMPQSSTYTMLRNRLAPLAMLHQCNANIAPPVMNTPTSTPGPSQNSLLLSTKRKRVHELAEKFVRVNEARELYTIQTTPKSNQREKFDRRQSGPPSSESRPSMQDYFSKHRK